MKELLQKAGKSLKVRKLLSILFWVLLWHLFAIWVDNDILLVTPWQTFLTLIGYLGNGVFWQTVCISLCRIGLGFGLGLVVALLLAVAGSRYPFLEELFAPLMTLCKAVPVAVFVVLLLIWWGSSFLAVAICFLIVLPNIYSSTLAGIKNTDRKLLEMAKVFRLSGLTGFFYIYRPALKPFLNSSLKLSLGLCWKSGVAAEVIGTPAYSIGEKLYMSKIHLDTAGVFAWAAVIILLSVGFEKVILWLAELFWNWEPELGGQEEKAASESFNVAEGALLSTQTPLLRVEGLNKNFGSEAILQNINVGYESGNIYYLTSPSGSGKTTFFRILCGLEKADSGKITSDIHYTVVFQEDRLCEDYSALRNLKLITGNEEKAKNALSCLLPEEAWSKPCSQLSGGMKRRVALARAMEGRSQCVLLDEPFTGMDAETRECAESYIHNRMGNRIVIIATHI